MPSGQGYELCREVCGQKGHAEEQALKLAGNGARGSIAYIEGIHYICMNCQMALTSAGIIMMTLGAPPQIGQPEKIGQDERALPPLPKCVAYGVIGLTGLDPNDGHRQLSGVSVGRPGSWCKNSSVELFTAYQMHDYARAALAQPSVSPAPVVAASDDLRNTLEMARQDLTLGRNLKARDRIVEALAMFRAAASQAAPAIGQAPTAEPIGEIAGVWLRHGEAVIKLRGEAPAIGSLVYATPAEPSRAAIGKEARDE
jgi:hypothetical protein